MQRLVKLLEFIISLNLDELLFNIYQQKKTQDLIISLNTKKQLFERSIDSRGVQLKDIGGGYSPVTELLNAGKSFNYQGATRTKITGESPFLFDEGDFYASFRVIPKKNGFEIIANPIKDDTNLFTEWGEEIVGLTTESKQILKEFLVNEIIRITWAQIDRLRVAA